MNIPDPIAWPDDPVDVQNYRSRAARWEPGVLQSMVYHPPQRKGGDGGAWHYRVRLERRSDSGGIMHLTVGAAQIIPRF